MAATDARPIPRKNTAYRLYFEYRDNTGALIGAAATTPDTEVSVDGAAFADCTNEFTDIGTTGCGYIDLTSSEMNGDAIYVKSTCANSNAKPFTIVIYPEEAGDIRADMVMVSGDSTAADNLETAFDDTAGAVRWIGIVDQGTMQSGSTSTTAVLRSALSLGDDILNGSIVRIVSGTGAGQTRIIDDFVGATDTATISPAWTTTPDNTSVYQVWAMPPASTGSPPAVNLTQIGGDAQSATDLKDFADAGYDPSTNKVQGVVLADAVTTVNGLAANVITAAATAADFTTEIQSGLATAAALDTVDNFLDTEVAAILAAVDTEVAAILALLDDARGEPAQGAPPVNPDAMTKIDYLYKAFRNKITQTATELSIYADNGTTVDHKATVSDDATTFTRGELISGA